MDVVACAAAYSITGGLVSETPEPTTSAYPTSTYEPATTTGYPSVNSTSAVETYAPSTYPGTGSFYPTATYPACSGTAFYAPTTAPTQTQVGVSGAGAVGPAGVLALLAAAGVAALL